MTPDGESGLPVSQGLSVDRQDPERLSHALDQAFDYRGDVTVVLLDGRSLEGYVYDRRRRPSPAIRLWLRDSEDRLLIADGEIERIEFSGRDTAAGKSFENWIKRYAEQKLRGESAGIESEAL